MDEKIFKLFKKESNEKLSQLDPYDLEFLLSTLTDYYIGYRDCLNIDNKITFGVEIEVANADVHEVKELVDLNRNLSYNWNTEFETSIQRGVEVNSTIMKDNKSYWNDLKEVCKILEKISIITNETSTHIHVSSSILGDKKQYWLNFIKMWAAYENIIYRFTNGEYINTRISAYEYAVPIKNILNEIYLKYKRKNSLYKMLCELSKDRDQAVNFMNVNKKKIGKNNYKNTIEFRNPNGTLNYIIKQNYINFFIKFLLYCTTSQYNDDIITKRFKSKEIRNLNFEMYNEIHLNQALELVDLIFDNTLDKINFLKQYLKNFEMSDRINSKCKRLTK